MRCCEFFMLNSWSDGWNFGDIRSVTGFGNASAMVICCAGINFSPQTPQNLASGLSWFPHLVQKFIAILLIGDYIVLNPHLPQNLAPGLNAAPH